MERTQLSHSNAVSAVWFLFAVVTVLTLWVSWARASEDPRWPSEWWRRTSLGFTFGSSDADLSGFDAFLASSNQYLMDQGLDGPWAKTENYFDLGVRLGVQIVPRLYLGLGADMGFSSARAGEPGEGSTADPDPTVWFGEARVGLGRWLGLDFAAGAELGYVQLMGSVHFADPEPYPTLELNGGGLHAAGFLRTSRVVSSHGSLFLEGGYRHGEVQDASAQPFTPAFEDRTFDLDTSGLFVRGGIDFAWTAHDAERAEPDAQSDSALVEPASDIPDSVEAEARTKTRLPRLSVAFGYQPVGFDDYNAVVDQSNEDAIEAGRPAESTKIEGGVTTAYRFGFGGPGNWDLGVGLTGVDIRGQLAVPNGFLEVETMNVAVALTAHKPVFTFDGRFVGMVAGSVGLNWLRGGVDDSRTGERDSVSGWGEHLDLFLAFEVPISSHVGLLLEAGGQHTVARNLDDASAAFEEFGGDLLDYDYSGWFARVGISLRERFPGTPEED